MSLLCPLNARAISMDDLAQTVEHIERPAAE